MSNPAIIVTDLKLCALTGFFYWSRNNLNRFADKDDIRGLTKAINGGYNGLTDRINLTNAAKNSLRITKIKLLQTNLNSKLNLKLAVDGAQGQHTNNAIAKFAQRYKLQTNTLTDSFWSALLS
jgi:putative chitinase